VSTLSVTALSASHRVAHRAGRLKRQLANTQFLPNTSGQTQVPSSFLRCSLSQPQQLQVYAKFVICQAESAFLRHKSIQRAWLGRRSASLVGTEIGLFTRSCPRPAAATVTARLADSWPSRRAGIGKIRVVAALHGEDIGDSTNDPTREITCRSPNGIETGHVLSTAPRQRKTPPARELPAADRPWALDSDESAPGPTGAWAGPAPLHQSPAGPAWRAPGPRRNSSTSRRRLRCRSPRRCRDRCHSGRGLPGCCRAGSTP